MCVLYLSRSFKQKGLGCILKSLYQNAYEYACPYLQRRSFSFLANISIYHRCWGFIGLFHTNGMNLPRWYCIKSIEKFTVAEPVEMGPVQKK